MTDRVEEVERSQRSVHREPRPRVPKQPAHDVFVSYSTQDKPVADAIVSRLEQAGIRCWVAPRDVLPGTVWGEAILHAIESSRLMVVVLSGESNRSSQVIREVERAIANDVVVVPFRIESIEPTGAMAYYLASEHWLDAMSPPLDSHISQLATVAHALLGTELPGGSETPDGEIEVADLQAERPETDRSVEDVLKPASVPVAEVSPPPTSQEPIPVARATRQPPPASTSAASPRSALPLAGIAAALFGVVALGVVGYLIGDMTSGTSTSDTSGTTPTRTVTSDELVLTVDRDWRPMDGQGVKGIDLRSPIALQNEDNVEIFAGQMDARGPTLLPSGFLALLKGRPEPEPVSLGGLGAYRYAGLEPEGRDGTLDIYVVPNDRGVATIACAAPRPATNLAPCETVAATLELRGAVAYGIGPSKSYARELSAAIRDLNGSRVRERARLNDASRPAAQARAAGVLADAYEEAAARLSGTEVSPESAPANAAVLAALRDARRAYGALARAARAGDPGAFDSARTEVGKAEDGVGRSLKRFERLGYSVSGSRPSS